ncbi:MAG: hypothetical protein J5717_06865, partial [Lachnospiraceae bacterium]|nr:hypothetical protein [Lachnospiraceae bacterium]
SLKNLNLDKGRMDEIHIGNKLRELNQLFDVVHLIDIEAKKITPLLGKYKYMSNNAAGDTDSEALMESFIEEKIFAGDRNRLRAFIDPHSLFERIKAGGKGYISGVFGVGQPDGNYITEEIFIMSVSGSGGREYLFCMKDYQDLKKNPYVIDINGTVMEEYAKLWDSIIWNSSLKFYWKDKNFAYRGVSQAFLDFFKMESPAEVLGKTDRELGLCTDADMDMYELHEKEIVSSGGKILKLPVECVVKGEPVMTILSEIPVYDDGKLVGTVGVFSVAGDSLSL